MGGWLERNPLISKELITPSGTEEQNNAASPNRGGHKGDGAAIIYHYAAAIAAATLRHRRLEGTQTLGPTAAGPPHQNPASVGVGT